MTDAQGAIDLRRLMDSDENRCFVCGPGNSNGLHLRFVQHGDEVRADFTPASWQRGWEGIIHGGILASVLDEAMAYAIFFLGVVGLTARMEVRYRAGVRYGDRLMVSARIVKDTRKLVDVSAQIIRDGELVAEATGRFVKKGPLSPDVLLG